MTYRFGFGSHFEKVSATRAASSADLTAWARRHWLSLVAAMVTRAPRATSRLSLSHGRGPFWSGPAGTSLVIISRSDLYSQKTSSTTVEVRQFASPKQYEILMSADQDRSPVVVKPPLRVCC